MSLSVGWVGPQAALGIQVVGTSLQATTVSGSVGCDCFLWGKQSLIGFSFVTPWGLGPLD